MKALEHRETALEFSWYKGECFHCWYSSKRMEGETVFTTELVTRAPVTTGDYTGRSIYDLVTHIMTYYVTGTIMTISVFTNFLSFIIMTRKEVRSQSTSVYLACLALSDIVCLIFFTLRIWYNVPYYCHVNHYLRSAATTFSGLLILMVTFERLVAVWFPLKASLWLSPRRSIIAITIAASFSFGLYVPRAIFTRDDCKALDFYAQIHFIEVLTFYSCVPVMLLITFNVAIIAKLNFGSSVLKDSTNNAKSTEIRRVTWMVITVAISYIILILPSNISLFHREITGKPIFKNPKAEKLGNNIAFTFFVIIHALNFWLYVTVSANFRKAIKRLLFHQCTKSNSGGSTASSISYAATSVSIMDEMTRKGNQT